MNYNGFFRSLDDVLYEVQIIAREGDDFKEVPLGTEPFVVTYESSQDPFEPIRKSTAVITFVSDEYPFEAFSPYADGTVVKLINRDDDHTEWCGYLKPNLTDQDYENCLEVIELEASDCISLLQYLTYDVEEKRVATIASILQNIFNKMGCINNYFVSKTKKINGAWMSLSDITISEQNFFSEDTDEPWTLYEVLEEICRYLGFTAIEYQGSIYLMDYQWLAKNNTMTFSKYVERNGVYTFSSDVTMNLAKNVTADSYRGAGANISMSTIYNKATVRAEIYDVKELLPSIFDDDNCTNRYGDWNKCQYITTYGKKQYINGGDTIKYEKYNDAKNGDDGDERNKIYVNRILDNKYFSSKYYNTSNLSEVTIYIPKIYSEIDQVVESSGQVQCRSYFRNDDNVPHTITYSLTCTADWWDTEYQMPDSSSNTVETSATLGPGESIYLSLEGDPFGGWTNLPDYPMSYGYSATFSTEGGFSTGVGNNEQNVGENVKYVGGTLVDLASYDRLPKGEYNYEPTPSLSFKRYLCINQSDKPEVPASADFFQVLDNRNGYAAHKPVFVLNDGFSRPFVVGSGSYLCLKCNSICTRYRATPYINSEWTDEATGIDGWFTWGAQMASMGAQRLIFKLGIGDYFFNGAGWTTRETCFEVPMSTNVDKKYKVEFSKLWNTEFHTLNNFSWEEWTGSEGYRIPLPSYLDTSGKITFEVHLPSKMQAYKSSSEKKMNVAKDSLNGYTWLSDLKITLENKGKDCDKDDDIIYENVILEDSLNELPEIVCKINTFPDRGTMSYSYAGLKSGIYLKTIQEPALSNMAQKPEENIVEKYVSLYSTPTKEESLTLDMSFTPFSRIRDMYWDTPTYFVPLAQTIRYAEANQTFSLIEMKSETADYLNVTPGVLTYDYDSDIMNREIKITSNNTWSID